MPEVRVRENENIESALKRFKKNLKQQEKDVFNMFYKKGISNIPFFKDKIGN